MTVFSAAFLKLLFLWNFFFSSLLCVVLCSASFYYKTTKSNYSVCEQCSLFTFFFISLLVCCYDESAIVWIHLLQLAVLLQHWRRRFAINIRCDVCFTSIGFLTHTNVCSTSCPCIELSALVNQLPAKLRIKRIDNEFTGVILRVASVFAPHRVTSEAKWKIEQFKKLIACHRHTHTHSHSLFTVVYKSSIFIHMFD